MECPSYSISVTPAVLPEVCQVLVPELIFRMQWPVERIGGLLICLMWVGGQLLQEDRT